MAKNITEQIRIYERKGLDLDFITRLLIEQDNYSKKYVLKSIKDHIDFENWYIKQLIEQD